jgi:hypothetical protein
VVTHDFVEEKPVSRNFETTTAATGIIEGIVKSSEDGKPLAGVTVVAQGAQGEQGDITDGDGHFGIAGLAPGSYVVRMFHGNVKVERQNVTVRADERTHVDVPMATRAASGETYTITLKAPTVDVGSTKIGATISGSAISGPTLAENNYVVDGVNDTSHHSGYSVPTRTFGLRPPPAYQRPATLAGGWDLVFPATGKDTVRSGQGARKVPLVTHTWPVHVARRVFPALAPDAYLVAELRNPSSHALPGGPASLFVGSDPAGVAELALMAPGEAVALPLGLDHALRPVRNVQLVTTEKGVFSKDEINEYEVSIELANSNASAMPVRIVDQVPLTDQKDVEVRLLRTEPVAAHDRRSGALEWSVSVPPSGKTRVSFVYSIKRPKGWRLHQ